MSPFAPLVASLRDELEALDERIEVADREGDPRGGGDEELTLRLRRERFERTLGWWGRPDDLRHAMAFAAALIDAAAGLDAETLDYLADKLRPPGVGKPGARGEP